MSRHLTDLQVRTVRGMMAKAAAVIRHEREVLIMAHAHLGRDGEPRMETLDETALASVGVFNVVLNRLAHADDIMAGRQPSAKAAIRARIRASLAKPLPRKAATKTKASKPNPPAAAPAAQGLLPLPRHRR